MFRSSSSLVNTTRAPTAPTHPGGPKRWRRSSPIGALAVRPILETTTCASRASKRNSGLRPEDRFVPDLSGWIVRIDDPGARIENILNIGLNLAPRRRLVLIGRLKDGLVATRGRIDAWIV